MLASAPAHVQSHSPAVACGVCATAQGVYLEEEYIWCSCLQLMAHYWRAPHKPRIIVARRRQHTGSLDGAACASCMQHVHELMLSEIVIVFYCRSHHADPAFQQRAPRQHAAAYPGSPLPYSLIRRHGCCRCAHQLCFPFGSCLQIHMPIDSSSFTLGRGSCPCIM